MENTVAPNLEDEYELGLHEIYGDDTLTHFRNNKKTCLNHYDLDETTKTFEINCSYDLLVIGMRVWANPEFDSNFYVVRFIGTTDYL